MSCIHFSSNESWPLVSNCQNEMTDTHNTPTVESHCTHILMDNHKSCCYVDLQTKDAIPVSKKICVAFPNTSAETIKQAKDAYSLTHEVSNIVCPTQSKIPNSCGIIGMMAPIDQSNCTMLNIPESHCCFVLIQSATQNYTACRRSDYIPNENTDNKTFTNIIKPNDIILDIQCYSNRLSINILIILLSLFL